MKQHDPSGLYFVLGLAIAGALGFGFWLIGGQVLAILAGVLVGAIAGALLILAGAVFARAWRKNDNPPVIEKHFYHDGTRTIERHTIDGRAEKPVLYQLPAQQGGPAFPDVLRAAYTAGLLTSGKREEDPVDGQARELPPDEWGGPIGH